MPCRGVPQTGHASAFNVISAPQHEQKAAMFLTLQNCYGLWMKAGRAKIQDGWMSSQDCVLGYSQPGLSKLAFFLRAGLDGTCCKQTSDQDQSGTVPKGRLNLAQHAMLGVTIEPDQSRRDG